MITSRILDGVTVYSKITILCMKKGKIPGNLVNNIVSEQKNICYTKAD